MVAESAPSHNKDYRYCKTYRYRRGSKLWKNCIHQKKILKMAGGRMHNPHRTPLDLPLAISYRNHRKSLAYFSHLAPLVVLFYSKAESKGGGGGGHEYAPDMSNAKIFQQLNV